MLLNPECDFLILLYLQQGKVPPANTEAEVNQFFRFVRCFLYSLGNRTALTAVKYNQAYSLRAQAVFLLVE